VCGFSCFIESDNYKAGKSIDVRFEFDDGEQKAYSTVYKIQNSYTLKTLINKLRRETMPPAAFLNFIGSNPENWRAVGKEFLGYFKQLCALNPDDHILDVGCGVGRMALPLSRYLNSHGSYSGFDVWKKGIEWCQKNISHQNFHFQHIDISNTLYKPDGTTGPEEFKFPYPDNSFTFTFLTSVFTHLRPEGVDNYLKEIHRTLKPGGRCLITYFLINYESKTCIVEGRSTIAFKLKDDFYHLFDPTSPETIIAYDEEHVRKIHESAHLPIDLLRYGSWCGRTNYLSYQDIVISHKPAE
jgi:ubiquinone/menaquinone biosynthesis C-methylase UbiE